MKNVQKHIRCDSIYIKFLHGKIDKFIVIVSRMRGFSMMIEISISRFHWADWITCVH